MGVERLVEEGRAFAEIMGFTVGAAPVKEGRWLIADSSRANFGQEVPGEAVGEEDCFVIRGDVALAKVGNAWVHASWVPDGTEEEWRVARWTGPGRDPRLTSSIRRSANWAGVSEMETALLWKPVLGKGDSAKPLPGPRVAPELFDALRTAGRTLTSHHAEWRSRSGVPAAGLACRFHGAVSEVLRMLVAVDGLDGGATVGPELCSRYLFCIESACDKNPKQPDWEGLENLVTFAENSRGGFEAPAFAKWVSDIQSSKAQILKQGRLLREERRVELKRGKNEKDGNGEVV